MAHIGVIVYPSYSTVSGSETLENMGTMGIPLLPLLLGRISFPSA
jgi:hypothetical protein